jgi:hypothetical protein
MDVPVYELSLSQAMRAYYLGSGGAAPVVNHRWQSFCARSGLSYTRSGGTVTWGSSVRAMLITRVNTFNDLYAAGGVAMYARGQLGLMAGLIVYGLGAVLPIDLAARRLQTNVPWYVGIPVGVIVFLLLAWGLLFTYG